MPDPVTQKQYPINPSQVAYGYGDIETWDGTSISDSDLLQVYLNDDLLTLTVHYTVDDVDKEIDLDAGLSRVADDVLTIKRMTDISDPYVDFTNNSTIDASDLDLATGQNRFKLQEIDTNLTNTLGLDTINDCWDAESKKICNLAAAVSSTDAVNLGQVQNILAGVDTAEIDNIVRWSFNGDGNRTDFTLVDAPTGLLDANQVMVFVGRVIQTPTISYTISNATGFTVLTFVSPPPEYSYIEVLTVQGIVSTEFSSDSVGTDAIADGAVTPAKINVGLGDADRLLVFDINGDGTARTIDSDDITDFDAQVRSSRLDQMTAPTADLSVNSNKITDLTAGSSGSNDACTVAQMEVYADAAATSLANNINIGSISTPSGVPSAVNWTNDYIRTISSSRAVFVTMQLSTASTNAGVEVKVKPSGGLYTTVGELASGSNDYKLNVSFFVPAGGTYMIDGNSSVSTGVSIDYLVEQTFA